MISTEGLKNRIFEGDCTKVLQDFEPDSIDVVVTSPPYNAGTDIGSGKKSKYDAYSDDLKADDYYNLISNTLTELIRVTKYYIFFNFQILAGNKDVYQRIMYDFRQYLKEYFIWAKTFSAPATQEGVVSSGFEFILCFSKVRPEKRLFDRCNFSNRTKGAKVVSNTIIAPPNTVKTIKENLAQFPKWLPHYFIKNFSLEGDLVLDPFMGMGTTAIVAKELKRDYCGIELDPSYVRIINERLKQDTLL